MLGADETSANGFGAPKSKVLWTIAQSGRARIELITAFVESAEPDASTAETKRTLAAEMELRDGNKFVAPPSSLFSKVTLTIRSSYTRISAGHIFGAGAMTFSKTSDSTASK
jgi:hypothetical protein